MSKVDEAQVLEAVNTVLGSNYGKLSEVSDNMIHRAWMIMEIQDIMNRNKPVDFQWGGIIIGGEEDVEGDVIRIGHEPEDSPHH